MNARPIRRSLIYRLPTYFGIDIPSCKHVHRFSKKKKKSRRRNVLFCFLLFLVSATRFRRREKKKYISVLSTVFSTQWMRHNVL